MGGGDGEDSREGDVIRRLGVIGDPVAHSISPAIQGAALRETGFVATYERWHTPAADLPGRIADLRAPDVLGANVTVPHKQAVISLLDAVQPFAQRAGAVNTIIHHGERLIGDNTDIEGFGTALAAACPDVAGRAAVVLGAGGAARAVVLALEQAGADPITVANRDPARAAALATALAPSVVATAGVDLETLRELLGEARLLVNATSVGWHGDDLPIPADLLAALPADAVLIDLTYRDTALLRAARDRGLAAHDGLAMLVYQGARAFTLWTGMDAPVEAMFAAARRAREG
ncbi:MAG: shikimate dehydrogenase [Chloroflexia bacterium]|nr:shikimate dehydrogenase [Chloroflexia bacterium]